MSPTCIPAFSSHLMPTNDRPPAKLCPSLLEDMARVLKVAVPRGGLERLNVLVAFNTA